MQRSKFTTVMSVASAGFVALALSGCGSSGGATQSPSEGSSSNTPTETTSPKADSNNQSGSNTSGSAGEATFSFGDKTFTSQLEFCSLTESEDALFHGVALDESGNPVGYLDGDFSSIGDDPQGEARIDLGATAIFQSTDEFFAMGTVSGHMTVTYSSAESLIVMGGVWDEQGTALATATVQVNC